MSHKKTFHGRYFFLLFFHSFPFVSIFGCRFIVYIKVSEWNFSSYHSKSVALAFIYSLLIFHRISLHKFRCVFILSTFYLIRGTLNPFSTNDFHEMHSQIQKNTWKKAEYEKKSSNERKNTEKSIQRTPFFTDYEISIIHEYAMMICKTWLTYVSLNLLILLELSID